MMRTDSSWHLERTSMAVSYSGMDSLRYLTLYIWQESPAQREVAAAIAVVDVPTLCSASVRAGTVFLGLAEIKAIPGHEQAGKIVDLA